MDSMQPVPVLKKTAFARHKSFCPANLRRNPWESGQTLKFFVAIGEMSVLYR
jgi:hypothetical protein